MSNDQNGKVAFITGANRGIGFQTASELGKLGVTLVLGTRDAKSGEKAAEALRKEGFQAESVVYDASKPETDRAVFKHLEAKYGRLDILVNNAGMMNEELMGFNDTSTLAEDKLRETFDVNFFAVVRLTQTLLPLVKKAPAGRIVNLSSILGSQTLHAAAESPIAGAKAFGYNSSKVALNAFTIHLANELKSTKIKVNSAHPGWVKTELGGPNAPMEIGESAKTSIWLATLGDEGPSGGFFHVQDALPW